MSNKGLYKFVIIVVCLMSLKSLAADSYTLPSGETIADPTKPELWQAPAKAANKQQKQMTFTLSYIVSSGQQKRAMINGKKVVEGDYVSGALVKMIRSDRVVLSYKGQQKELRMNKIQGIQRSAN